MEDREEKPQRNCGLGAGCGSGGAVRAAESRAAVSAAGKEESGDSNFIKSHSLFLNSNLHYVHSMKNVASTFRIYQTLATSN